MASPSRSGSVARYTVSLSLASFFQLIDELLLALDGLVVGLEVVLDIHAQLALGQVPQMAHSWP